MSVYIDVSNLMEINFLTGIQRVVREVVIRLLKNKTLDVRLISFSNGKFQIVCNEDFLRSYDDNLISQKLISKNDIIDVEEFSKDDLLFDIDAVWNSRYKRTKLYPLLKRNGVKIVTYVYDIIPIEHPELSHPNTLFNFMGYISAVLEYSDLVMVSAQTTLDKINILTDKLRSKRINGFVTWLGSDFKIKGETSEEISDEAKDIVSKGKYILVVGTIEPRKNHKLILDAYDEKLAELGINVVFAGKIGWRVEDLVERIENHPKKDSGLYHLQGQNDATIDYLYKNAFVVAFATFDEGFGLPMVEAFERGAVLVSSDVPVIKEVGKEFSEYFNPGKPSEFSDLIEKYLSNTYEYAKRKEIVKKFKPTTWDEVTERMEKYILTLKNDKKLPIPSVKQIVFLSARIDDLLSTLPFIEKYMAFIKELVVICPDKMAVELKSKYNGRFTLTTLTDSEVLNGNSLPEDHQARNFFLRCLAIKNPKIDDVFIMTDDDYRPLKNIEISTFIENGKYNAYFCHNLDEWQATAWSVDSFSIGAKKTLNFLKENGYTYKEYASHQPQIIDKRIFLEMLEKHPGIEETGLDEWSAYFNFAQFHYPSMFLNKIYKTLNWPGSLTDWNIRYKPQEFLFENYYENLYDQNQIFSGFSKEFSANQEYENEIKIKLANEKLDKFISFQNKFNDFGKYYEESFLEKLNFSFIKNEAVEKLMLPKFLVLEKGAFAYVPFDIKFDSAPEFYEIEILFMKDGVNISASKNMVISNFDFDVKLPIRVPDLKGDASLLLKLTIENSVFEKSIPAKIIEFYENIPITYQYETEINLLMQQKRNEELQWRLAELAEKNEELQTRLVELGSYQKKTNEDIYNFILNTRHRTLYGACAWVFRKVFRRK